MAPVASVIARTELSWSRWRGEPGLAATGSRDRRERDAVAARAALVGRLVLSTLHVSAPDLALTRLVDLGVEAFVARDVLVGVLGQTLVPGEEGVRMEAALRGSVPMS